MNFFEKCRNLLWQLMLISLKDTIRALSSSKHILRWSDDQFNKNNFGDALNPLLFSKVSNGQVVSVKNVLNFTNKPVFYFIGSILDNSKEKNAIVCGAGFQKENSRFRRAPKEILAVRGPLSRQIALKQGLSCPEVYCDPALLLPFYYPRNNYKKLFNVGIIPHYADKNILDKLEIERGDFTFNIINIEDNVESVIDKICEVDYILSSSLHGLIVAHAYQIPAAWLLLSDNVIGGDFKFKDYYFSVGADAVPTYAPTKVINLSEGVATTTLHDTNKNAQALLKQFEKYFQKEVKHELS
ncbi:polysaccharide pyruvyl transferase family protein [Paraglaciecola aestuariivivens]